MKLSTKIILPVILISVLSILLTGCFGLSDDSPGYTPGSITGRIMIPSQCADCLTDGPCLPKGISDFIPSHWVSVEDAIVTVIPHATLTNEDGYYTLTDVEPGVYYVITATYKNLVLKDVVEPDGVEAGKSYDAGTANCESTALGLYVEYLWDMEVDIGDIESMVEEYIETDKFADLVSTVCCIIEDCDNITNYCCLVECDEPEYTPELESITVNTGSMNLCLDDSQTLPSVSVFAHYTEGEPSKVVTSSAVITYTSNDPSIASLSGTTVTGKALGSTSINVSAAYTEGDITVDSTGTVPVNVIDCSTCIPELDSLTVVLGNTTPMTLCDGATTTINSSHIASIIAHYTCDVPDVTLLLSEVSYESEDSGIASVSGLDVTGNSVGSTNIIVSYTDLEKTVTATQKVPVEVQNCLTEITVAIDPDPMILCLTGTGFPDIGTIVTTAHYSDGSSAVVTPDLYDGYSGIISVNAATGVVNSLAVGSTTITVHYEDKTATVDVTVNDCTSYYTLTMAVDPTGGGTTNPAVGSHTYPENEVVTLTATAASGYNFVNWTGDASGTNPPTTVTMDGDKTVTANFARENIITSINIAGWENAGCHPNFDHPHEPYSYIETDPSGITGTIPLQWLTVTNPNLKSVHFFANVDAGDEVTYRYTTDMDGSSFTGWITLGGGYVSSECIEIPGAIESPPVYPTNFYIEINVNGVLACTINIW